MTENHSPESINKLAGLMEQAMATLKSLSAHAQVHFPVIIWHVEQTYQNQSDEFVELVYTFPTSHNSILQNISVKLQNRELVGQIVPRNEAEDRYSDALADGDSAILIERNEFGLYTANIGNLGPGETCRIRYESAAVLEVVENHSKIIFPTVIGERFGDPSKGSGLGNHAQPSSSWLAEYNLDLSINLNGQSRQFDVSSSTHKISVTQGSSLGVGLSDVAYLDRDFELTLGNIQQKPVGLIFKDPFSDVDQYMSLSRFVLNERISNSQNNRASTLKILIDCSGSMFGERIQQAKTAVHSILASLNQTEKFTLTKFGEEVCHFRSKPIKAGASSLKSAFKWIEALEADMGGTALADAVKETSQIGDNESADILLITDGEIWSGSDFINSLADRNARLFVVAIGESSNSNMLTSAAKTTGGHIETPHSDQQIEEAALRLYKRIRTPRTESRGFTVGGKLCTWHDELPTVFENQSIDVMSIHAHPASESVLCISRDAENHHTDIMLISNLETIDDPKLAETLSRVCMNKAIQGLEREYGFGFEKICSVVEKFDIEDDNISIKELAILYGLLSEETSFLLVEERKIKADEMPRFKNIAQMEYARGSRIYRLSRSLGSVLRNPSRFNIEPLMLMKSVRTTEARKAYYKASIFEKIIINYIDDVSLRTDFAKFSASFSESITWTGSPLTDPFSQIEDSVGARDLLFLLNRVKKQISYTGSESDVLKALINLINLMISGERLTYTQFSPGSLERKIAQLLGFKTPLSLSDL